MTTRPHALSQRFSRRLTLLAAAPLVLAGLFVIGVTLAQAEDAPTVTLHHLDRAPATPAAAARLYRQLDRAALAVCGGGDHAFAEVNRSTRLSACWRDAMRQALAQVNSPRLPLALADNPDRRP